MHGSVFFELIGCATAGFDLSKGEVGGGACQRPRTILEVHSLRAQGL